MPLLTTHMALEIRVWALSRSALIIVRVALRVVLELADGLPVPIELLVPPVVPLVPPVVPLVPPVVPLPPTRPE